MLDATTVAVAVVGGISTLIAASQDQLFGPRLHRRQKIEDLRFERDAKEREAIYELFDRLPDLEAAALSYISQDEPSDEIEASLVSSFARARPHMAILRDRDVRAAVSAAMAATNQIARYGQPKTDWAKKAVASAERDQPELSPISTLMSTAFDQLARRLDELYA